MRQVPPSRLAREAHYTRQHVLSVRGGLRPSPRCQTTLAATLRTITEDQTLAEHEVFEQVGTPIETLLPGRSRRKERRRGGAARPLALAERIAALDDADIHRWQTAILATSGAHTETAIRMLLDVGEKLLDRRPARADQLYRTAIAIEKLLSDTPPLLRAALRAHAEKGRANALRMLGLYREALPILRDAEQSFLDARYCAADIGHVLYTRATVLMKMERWAEAAQASEQAHTLLAAERDRRGALRAQLLRGCIHVEQGELDQARALFLALRKPFERLKDRDALARLWMNLAVCDLRRGFAFGARHALNRASNAFRTRGMKTELVRTRWCGAKVLLLEGNRPKALRELRAAERAFTALQMPLDAAFVALDLLAELVDDSESRSDVVAIAQRLVELFTVAGVVVSAAHAIQLLRDAVIANSAHRAYIEYAHRYVTRSFVFPTEPFTPPAREQR